jgi:transcriptional regulator with XRE-family HTH domain
MSQSLPSIELNLVRKLQNEQYRRRFFLAEASADIARQLVRLRRRRKLSQKQLAEKAGMAQPRISKVERADYENWSFNTLRRLADAMDARLRVIIEPAEDVLFEYQGKEPGSVRYLLTANLPPLSQEKPRAAEFGQGTWLTQNEGAAVYGSQNDRQQSSSILHSAPSAGGTALLARRPQRADPALSISESSDSR